MGELEKEKEEDEFGFDDDEAAMTEEDRAFEEAALYVRKHTSKLSRDSLLYLYARFKYINEGPCIGPRPTGLFNFEAKAKYDQWKALGQTKPKSECKAEYVQKLDKAAKKWRKGSASSASGKSEDNSELAGAVSSSSKEEFSNAERKGTFGVKISVMAPNESELNAENVTSFDICKAGDLSKLRVVMNACNKDQVDENQMTTLMWACDRGSLDIVKFLVDELGADPNKQDLDGQTCLHYAVSCEHVDVVKYLAGVRNLDRNLADSDGLKPVDSTQNKEIVDILSV
jgi:acyl-CoA-binding protein